MLMFILVHILHYESSIFDWGVWLKGTVFALHVWNPEFNLIPAWNNLSVDHTHSTKAKDLGEKEGGEYIAILVHGGKRLKLEVRVFCRHL